MKSHKKLRASKILEKESRLTLARMLNHTSEMANKCEISYVRHYEILEIFLFT